jgi:hypothetical protein
MKLTLERPGRLPIVVSVADDQERQGKAILARLAELDPRGPELKEGSTIDFGWSRLTLEDGYDELRLHEPDFGGNALTETSSMIDCTIEVETAQVSVLAAIGGLAGVDARYDSTVYVKRGALEKDRVFLQRQAPEGRHSGWYIGETGNWDEVKADDVEVMYVFQVYKVRPALLKVMALPPGYIAAMNRTIIEAVMEPGGKVVLRDF